MAELPKSASTARGPSSDSGTTTATRDRKPWAVQGNGVTSTSSSGSSTNFALRNRHGNSMHALINPNGGPVRRSSDPPEQNGIRSHKAVVARNGDL